MGMARMRLRLPGAEMRAGIWVHSSVLQEKFDSLQERTRGDRWNLPHALASMELHYAGQIQGWVEKCGDFGLATHALEAAGDALQKIGIGAPVPKLLEFAKSVTIYQVGGIV